jgi:hypothetical protein
VALKQFQSVPDNLIDSTLRTLGAAINWTDEVQTIAIV